MKYTNQTRFLVAVDCIVFGFDGTEYKLLLIQRGFAPEKEKWSLMGGFLLPEESMGDAAARILKQLTGLQDIYLEEMQAFSKPDRDPMERVIAMAYVALIDIKKYQQQINDDFHARWFPMKELPKLIFDHQEMVDTALNKLRYKAAFHPILFELLPEKFTLPQLQTMYEGLYNTKFDKRNFTRKVLSTKLLKKEKEKEKLSSKKGAFYYSLDQEQYKQTILTIQNFIPLTDITDTKD
ncbi:NUDIX domain-containing protein [Aquiflexum sp. LQ15W]|uniref:NUDIX hydrolase n=1 Tax=Cognataquiflexum nitidum TaxID=2922272 RepID=UPI001F14974D|nr:NUDIX domain-containing protein [Cognataquiflexum nitidum]MCH6198900.1 NUDIX domain-containing protein [Cognataquiflexum nitidum]